MGATTPTHHRFKLGGFEVTTLLVGTRTTEKPQETFGLNATPEDFAAPRALGMRTVRVVRQIESGFGWVSSGAPTEADLVVADLREAKSFLTQ